MVSQNEETDFQAITDLVAVHTLTQIAWQNSQEMRAEDELVAGHQSDNQIFEEMGGHHSDSDIQLEREAVNPIAFAWRLMKLLRRFFEGR